VRRDEVHLHTRTRKTYYDFRNIITKKRKNSEDLRHGFVNDDVTIGRLFKRKEKKTTTKKCDKNT